MSNGLQTLPSGAHGTCGAYRVVAHLGSGGMADVDLALAKASNGQHKLVVLKRLFRHSASNLRLRAMLYDEAQIATRLKHPNIVRTYAMGQHGCEYFIVMEYLQGQSLADVLKRTRPRGLPIGALLRIVADVCAGLDYAHGLADHKNVPLGFVHRDVSPQNVFITYAGQVKLIDFGIAKTAIRTDVTEAGMLKGKLAYMSPEHAQGQEVDRRSDVFSLGIILYEALTMRRLWDRSMPDLLVLRSLVIGDIPSSPRAIAPHVPEQVDRICRRALAPKPEDRYASAEEMRLDLERAMAELGEPTRPAELGTLVARQFVRERRALAAVLKTALGVSGASLWKGVLAPIPCSDGRLDDAPAASSDRSSSCVIYGTADFDEQELATTHFRAWPPGPRGSIRAGIVGTALICLASLQIGPVGGSAMLVGDAPSAGSRARAARDGMVSAAPVAHPVGTETAQRAPATPDASQTPAALTSPPADDAPPRALRVSRPSVRPPRPGVAASASSASPIERLSDCGALNERK